MDIPDGDYSPLYAGFSDFFLLLINQGLDYAVIPLIVFIVFLIFGSAMISGSEVAFFSMSSEQLDELKGDDKQSKRIISLLRMPEYLLATILITNNLFNIGIITTSFFLIKKLLVLPEGSWIAFLVNGVLVTFVLVLFGEIIPKVYANQHNVRLARITASPLHWLSKICYPISTILVNSTSFIEKRLHDSRDEVDVKEVQEAIDSAVGMVEASEIDQQEIELLKGIVSLRGFTVKQIMTNRLDVISLERNIGFDQLRHRITSCGFSRFPVIDRNIDNVKGILHAKDLLEHLYEQNDYDWLTLMNKPFYVPETKKVDQLLSEMQQLRTHMAIVVDEYGGTAGLITMEDILEQVVGEIQDEFDEEADLFVKHSENDYTFDGSANLLDICKALDIDDYSFDEVRGDSDSLAGLLMEIHGSFPEVDTEIQYLNLNFRVLSYDDNDHINEVRISFTKNDDEIPQQAPRV